MFRASCQHNHPCANQTRGKWCVLYLFVTEQKGIQTNKDEMKTWLTETSLRATCEKKIVSGAE